MMIEFDTKLEEYLKNDKNIKVEFLGELTFFTEHDVLNYLNFIKKLTSKYVYFKDILLHTIEKDPMYLNKTLHRFLVNIEDSYLLNKKDIAFIVDKEGRGGDNLESIFSYLYEYIISKRFESWNKDKLNC